MKKNESQFQELQQRGTERQDAKATVSTGVSARVLLCIKVMWLQDVVCVSNPTTAEQHCVRRREQRVFSFFFWPWLWLVGLLTPTWSRDNTLGKLYRVRGIQVEPKQGNSFAAYLVAGCSRADNSSPSMLAGGTWKMNSWTYSSVMRTI